MADSYLSPELKKYIQNSSGESASFGNPSNSNPSSVVGNIANDMLKMIGRDVQPQFSVPPSFDLSDFSEMEKTIFHSKDPIVINGTETAEVHDNKGLHMNFDEVKKWKGILPISAYPIKRDDAPLIHRKSDKPVNYDRNVHIKYLRPPSQQSPGEIIIRKKNILPPPAPPLIIRVDKPRLRTPEPITIREEPPLKKAPIEKKIIKIKGDVLKPPPRKLVIEYLAQQPAKPESIFVERWLKPEIPKRKVTLEVEAQDEVPANPKNYIILWGKPDVIINKKVIDMGISSIDPEEYKRIHADTIKKTADLPDEVKSIKAPNGEIFAADSKSSLFYDLEGDKEALEAFKQLDLAEHGLSEYIGYFDRKSSVSYKTDDVILQLFKYMDTDGNGKVTRSEAEDLVFKLNESLGRNYSKNEASIFVQVLDKNGDDQIDLDEFRAAITRLYSNLKTK